MDHSTILEKQGRFLFPNTINYYRRPLAVASAHGAWVTDVEGTRYLDFFGGILTVSLGHCDETVTGRIIEQLRRVQHTSTLYPNEWIVTLAEAIAEVTPEGLSRSFFTSSGTEA
ncbi:MAG: aminotransferase class III-fold pyridoxal phosphate-dependent enzyme, partial [Deltaproteobacteria bacterium]|nr:aminotransferase class III-fold pyridoxal phosphate-dependent enzyme [Deltaproteobacteria bacterium]